jgi:hypothetical protein
MKRLLLILLLLLTAIVESTEKRSDTNHPDSNNEMSLEVLQDLRAGDALQQVGIMSDNKSTQLEIFMRTMEEQLQKISSLFAAEQKETSNLATH